MTAERSYDGDERRTPCNSPHELRCQFADSSAERAVEKTFAIFGVNIHEPKEVAAFQDSLRFNERLKKMADKGVIALWVAFVSFLGISLYIGIKYKITGKI